MKLKARSLPVLVGILLLLQLIMPYEGWLILIVGLGGAWLLSFLWARSLKKSLRISRELRFSSAKVGDQILERFKLANPGWAEALWVTVKDHSNLPGYEGDKVTRVGNRAGKSWLKRNYCNTRGLYTFGPTTLSTGDPFGIYEVEVHSLASNNVLVLPPVVALPIIDIVSGERVGGGRQHAFSVERSVSSASIREYVPGDNPRSIHWSQSARRDELFVRIFDSKHSSDWWIILDMFEDVQEGKGETSTEEHGIVLAASLADRGWKFNRSVGLVAQGKGLTWLPPSLGQGQKWELMRSLALLKLGNSPLSEVLARTQSSLSQRTSVVLITSDVEGEWLDSLVSLIRRGISITALILDPVTFGGKKDASETLAKLSRLGVSNFRITPDLVAFPEFQKPQEEVSTATTALDKITLSGNHYGNGRWKELG